MDPVEDLLARNAAGQGKPRTRTIFGKYDADNTNKIAEGLDRDLQKIFTWPFRGSPAAWPPNQAVMRPG